MGLATDLSVQDSPRYCPRGRWLVPFAIVLLGGCVPDSDPSAPVAESFVTELRLGSAESQRTGPWTIRDEFAAMARRLPGGFGGMYLDGGVLQVVSTDSSQGGELLSALREEPVITARRSGPGSAAFSVENAQLRPGTYRYDQLYDWFGALNNAMRITPVRKGISERRNRIVIGVGRSDHQSDVERAVAAAGVPPAAVIIEVERGRFVSTKKLTDKFRPVPAGVKVQYTPGFGPTETCTLGPQALWVADPGNPQPGFLVNAHCTWQMGVGLDEGDTTYFYQNTEDCFLCSNYVGNGAIDAPVYDCPENPTHGCMYADAALGLYKSSVEQELGKIARPATRGDTSLVVDPNNPRFTISHLGMYPVAGEVLEKVGQTTGWSGGDVLEGCEDITPVDDYGNPSGPTIRCSTIIDVGVTGYGDSGSPIFEVESGTDVNLRGIVWGFRADSTCGELPGGEAVCSVLVASPIGSIVSELEGVAECYDCLEFVSEGSGGGGGGGGPPDPPSAPGQGG